MKKNYIYSLAATFITAALAMGSLTACSVDDIFASHHNAQAKTYTVSIPASIGEGSNTRAVEFGNDGSTITTRFEAGDNVYVYNETKGAIACDGNGILIPLTLTAGDIKNDGRNCTLSGDLTFYKYDGNTLIPANPDNSDTYSLLYNMNKVDAYYPEYSFFDYYYQDGSDSKASDCDFAMKSGVTMTATGNALVPSATVTFQSLQSMFRQRLSFTQGPNNEGSTTPIIKQLKVSTKNGTLAGAFSPLRPIDSYFPSQYDLYEKEIEDPQITSDGDIYLSLAFDYGVGHVAAGDELQLEAIDTDGHVYVASKAVPSGGFTTGKYYHGSMTLAWSEQRYVKPTITPSVSPNSSYHYSIDGSGAALAYTISGTSKGYNFYIGNYSSCTLTLSSLNAEYDNGSYISGPGDDGLNIVVNGANTLNCPSGYIAIGADFGNLQLSGNGTLTVTSYNADYCGLKGNNYTSSNNNHATTTKLNVSSQLAADGYTVMRSARTDGPDANNDGNPDYYTWTYTVYPYPSNVNLASLTGNYTALDGQVLSGTLDGSTQPYKISIADGATVTLDGVTINGANNNNYKWAGINCEGDATIILKDGTTNVVKGFYEDYPGIYIAENKTLTIQGNTGTLAASPFNGGSSGNYGAGIGGGGYSASCGNIVIEGGVITATGGQYAAGIGCGIRKSCGNITISGGTVTAYGNGGASGIGSGLSGSCGSITISGTACVEASCVGTNSEQGGAGIGSAFQGGCGDISISTSGTVTATGEKNAAGIGSGSNNWGSSGQTYCGNISITGGTITAEGKGFGAGIGSGYNGASCGTITIGSGITSVSAKSNHSTAKCIGAGYSGTCGTVTVATGLSDNGTDSDGTRVISHQ